MNTGRSRLVLYRCRYHASHVPQADPPVGTKVVDQDFGATLSHVDVGVRDLRNDTARVIDALRAGERITLTVRGEPVADIVPHGGRSRWLSGASLRGQLNARSADPALRKELDELAGETLADL